MSAQNERVEEKMRTMERILIADESRLHRAVVTTILREAGHSTLEAKDGPSALAQTSKLDPDLLILDWLMPGMNGLEVCERLKHNRMTRHIPILLFTLSNSPGEKAQALETGADGYLTKPFHKQELRAIVDATLRRRHQYDPLTHLPASLLIRNHIERLLDDGAQLAVGLLDIDHFKAYNDSYGRAAGDKVIKQLSHIIHASTNGSGDTAFIGHLGGDDFIIACDPQKAEKICKSIQRAFRQTVPTFYTSADHQRGYVEVADRKGDKHRYSSMTLSVAITGNHRRKLHDYAQVSDILRELSAFIKRQGGGRCIIDRRTDE